MVLVKFVRSNVLFCYILKVEQVGFADGLAMWVENEFFGLSQKKEGVALYQRGREWEK